MGPAHLSFDDLIQNQHTVCDDISDFLYFSLKEKKTTTTIYAPEMKFSVILLSQFLLWNYKINSNSNKQSHVHAGVL